MMAVCLFCVREGCGAHMTRKHDHILSSECSLFNFEKASEVCCLAACACAARVCACVRQTWLPVPAPATHLHGVPAPAPAPAWRACARTCMASICASQGRAAIAGHPLLQACLDLMVHFSLEPVLPFCPTHTSVCVCVCPKPVAACALSGTLCCYWHMSVAAGMRWSGGARAPRCRRPHHHQHQLPHGAPPCWPAS